MQRQYDILFQIEALQLKLLIAAKKQLLEGGHNAEDISRTIEYLCGKIRDGHLMDFGLELKWTKESETSSCRGALE